VVRHENDRTIKDGQLSPWTLMKRLGDGQSGFALQHPLGSTGDCSGAFVSGVNSSLLPA
jgi:hypothetical protein